MPPGRDDDICQACERILEHSTRQTNLQQSLSLVTHRAVTLLSAQSPGGAPGVVTASVTEERRGKAEKFTLATRLRDLRLAIAATKTELEDGRDECDARRDALAARRERLRLARERMLGLEVQPGVEQSAWDTLRQAKGHSLGVFHGELAHIFAFSTTSPLDPFSTSETATPTLHGLTIPSLSLAELQSYPPNPLSFLLSQLLLLVRLMALYRSLPLPFIPSPTAYAGVVGWGGLLPSNGARTKPLRSSSGISSTSLPIHLHSTPGGSSLSSTSTSPAASTAAPPTSLLTSKPSSSSDSKSSSPRKKRTTVLSAHALKALQSGYAALTFDYAYLLWEAGENVSLEDIGNVGVLVARVLRLRFNGRREEDEVFPIGLEEVMARYFPPPVTRQKEKKSAELPEQEEVDEEEEEEWNLV